MSRTYRKRKKSLEQYFTRDLNTFQYATGYAAYWLYYGDRACWAGSSKGKKFRKKVNKKRRRSDQLEITRAVRLDEYEPIFNVCIKKTSAWAWDFY